jgi:hypothetical protein
MRHADGSSSSLSYLPKAFSAAICSTIGWNPTFTDGSAVRSFSVKSSSVLIAGLLLVSTLAIDPSAATPMILAVPRVLSQVRIIGAMPAVAKSSEPEISASIIDAAPDSFSHSIFGGAIPSALASCSTRPFSLATISGR